MEYTKYQISKINKANKELAEYLKSILGLDVHYIDESKKQLSFSGKTRYSSLSFINIDYTLTVQLQFSDVWYFNGDLHADLYFGQFTTESVIKAVRLLAKKAASEGDGQSQYQKLFDILKSATSPKIEQEITYTNSGEDDGYCD